MKKFKKFLIWLFGGIFLGILGNLATKAFFDFDFISPVISFFGSILHLFSRPITFPLWGTILLSFSGLFVLGLIFFVFLKKNNLDPPRFLNYVSDHFFGINWHWNWRPTGRGFDYSDPCAICPRCSSQMDPFKDSLFDAIEKIAMVCEHCNYKREFDENFDHLLHKVRKEIDRKIRTEEFEENRDTA